MADSTTNGAHSSLGRNEPCHCASGKKYKQCCLAKDEEVARKSRAEANARSAATAAATAAEAAAEAPSPSKAKETHPRHRQKGGGSGTSSRGFQKAVGGPRKVGGG